MGRIALALGFAAGLALAAGIAPALAGEPGAAPEPPRPRNFYNAPTDEFVPPVPRRAPRARRDDTSLSALFQTGRFDSPPVLADKPVTGGPVYAYLPTLAPAARLFYAPVSPPVDRFTREDFDGAPCPTLSRDSLGALFACTLR
jgi:hypothetical protein